MQLKGLVTQILSLLELRLIRENNALRKRFHYESLSQLCAESLNSDRKFIEFYLSVGIEN